MATALPDWRRQRNTSPLWTTHLVDQRRLKLIQCLGAIGPRVPSLDFSLFKLPINLFVHPKGGLFDDLPVFALECVNQLVAIQRRRVLGNGGSGR